MINAPFKCEISCRKKKREEWSWFLILFVNKYMYLILHAYYQWQNIKSSEWLRKSREIKYQKFRLTIIRRTLTIRISFKSGNTPMKMFYHQALWHRLIWTKIAILMHNINLLLWTLERNVCNEATSLIKISPYVLLFVNNKTLG